MLLNLICCNTFCDFSLTFTACRPFALFIFTMLLLNDEIPPRIDAGFINLRPETVRQRRSCFPEPRHTLHSRVRKPPPNWNLRLNKYAEKSGTLCQQQRRTDSKRGGVVLLTFSFQVNLNSISEKEKKRGAKVCGVVNVCSETPHFTLTNAKSDSEPTLCRSLR